MIRGFFSTVFDYLLAFTVTTASKPEILSFLPGYSQVTLTFLSVSTFMLIGLIAQIVKFESVLVVTKLGVNIDPPLTYIKDDWSCKCDTNLKLWNGPLLKLQRFQIDPTREETEREHINLYFCHAEYFDFLASNHQIRLGFLAGASEGVRARYAQHLDSLRDLHLSPLANTPGLTTLIVRPTSPRRGGPERYECLLVKRESRSQLAHYLGAWQVSTAGNIHPSKDLKNGLPDPFKAAARESKRELADLRP